ncbi:MULTISPECIES: aspartate/glutamate racemase family protein [Tenacibaculum]|uniref:aspartate/glutamate racemase family protein n=2 Tax=Flavobacteriaceae TaxID=49546 RepID=UPI001F0B226A|nr:MULTISPECIES: aspartate/glutamate racemase family protein [Tenacibaculum]MCH3882962.1 aspartate/glutamate racemase family protein [Tenacibaculum aquimarinum]MDO6600776.1 aspartate/glutamate racemase family protein [Tenacibaculum sp. 1_MG-2023]
MKTIGLIGGITPQSTMMYYQVLNELAAEKYGEHHSAKIVIHSVDFGEIKKHQLAGRWDLLDEIMASAGKSLERAGASCILICANTMHLCIDAIENVVSIPVIHIAEATGKQIQQKNLKKVALLGTKYTMDKTFYRDVLGNFSLETLIPNSEDKVFINDVIYTELSKGIVSNVSKNKYIDIIKKLTKEGAEGIILGCTEIPLLVQQNDVTIPVFDTTTIHATEAFNFVTKE